MTIRTPTHMLSAREVQVAREGSAVASVDPTCLHSGSFILCRNAL
jgi:hypothetical protein